MNEVQIQIRADTDTDWTRPRPRSGLWLWLFLPLCFLPPSVSFSHSLFLCSILVFLFEFFCVNLLWRISAKGSTCPLFTAVLRCSLPVALCSSLLLPSLAKNCAKNQFCLLFFCNVFLAKTNPHASPIAISLCCCVSLLLFLPARLRQCSVRFASGIVSFFFVFFYALFCWDFLPPAPRLNGCLPQLSLTCSPSPPLSLPGVALLCLCANFIRIWTVRFYFMQKSRSTWTLLAVVVAAPVFPSLTVSVCLSLLLLLTCRCFARTHTHTHAQLMRIGNKERRSQLVNYKFRSVFGLFFGCFWVFCVAYLHKLAAQLMGII